MNLFKKRLNAIKEKYQKKETIDRENREKILDTLEHWGIPIRKRINDSSLDYSNADNFSDSVFELLSVEELKEILLKTEEMRKARE
ncbi:MAG: hypothetical protein LBR74_00700 [Eubacterium sp.]|jgi:hypothetical protein|nr:hypothetical protein [Eubacterium sp.]